MSTTATEISPSKVSRRQQLQRLIPGLGISIAIAFIATIAARYIPLVGGPVLAIVFGVIVALLKPLSTNFQPGLRFSSRSVLQFSVIVLGFGLSMREVLAVGVSSLPVLLGSLAAALAGGWIVARVLGIKRDLALLVSVGTGICGASAIAATSATIGAGEADVAYAIATIFTFNVAAVLSFPWIGHLMGMSPHSFGLFAGTAVNDLSSVVAASTVYAKASVGYAVIVKLTRTLMIVPITIAASMVWTKRQEHHATSPSASLVWTQIRRGVPPFLILFVLAVAFNSTIGVPSSIKAALPTLTTWLITLALAGIGLSTKINEIRSTGYRPLAMGAALWIIVAVTSLGLQQVVGVH